MKPSRSSAFGVQRSEFNVRGLGFKVLPVNIYNAPANCERSNPSQILPSPAFGVLRLVFGVWSSEFGVSDLEGLAGKIVYNFI